MGSIFASGTMSAAPIAALAALPLGRARLIARRCGAALLCLGLLPGAAPTTTLDVSIDKLRSTRGELRFCLTADPKNFPGCVDDAHAVTRSVPAASRHVRFDGLPAGSYAIAVIHDANGNNKLDTVLGIPREGFGFSRNPAIAFGPPRFAAARFDIGDQPVEQQIGMRYLL